MLIVIYEPMWDSTCSKVGMIKGSTCNVDFRYMNSFATWFMMLLQYVLAAFVIHVALLDCFLVSFFDGLIICCLLVDQLIACLVDYPSFVLSFR